MEQLKDKIQEIENEVRYYEEQQHLDCCDYSEQIDTLLKLRKKILDRYVIDNLDKFIDKICEFDERLTYAFRQDYEDRERMIKEVTNIQGKNKQIESHLFLKAEAGETPFWLFMNHFSFDDSYSLLGVGYAKSFKARPIVKTVLTFDDTTRALKEARELFMDRPLSSSFYYLYEETNFSLLDIVSVRSFYPWITIKIDEYTTRQIGIYEDQRH